MNIIVLLSPIHFSYFELSFINQRNYLKGDNNYFPFQKTNKSINK